MVAFLMLCLLTLTSDRSFGQTIEGPVERPHFVIERKSDYTTLPKHLGGHFVNGFAAVEVSVNDAGKLMQLDVIKIKVSGRTSLSYQRDVDRTTDTVSQYESFLQRHVSEKVNIVKTDRPSPPNVTKIYFLIRFR